MAVVRGGQSRSDVVASVSLSLKCIGPCGGVPGYRAPSGLPCPGCMGAGIIYLKTWAEEQDEAAEKFEKRKGRPKAVFSQRQRKRRKRRMRASKTQQRRENHEAHRRHEDAERILFKKNLAPTDADLDQLKKENESWLQRPRNR